MPEPKIKFLDKQDFEMHIAVLMNNKNCDKSCVFFNSKQIQVVFSQKDKTDQVPDGFINALDMNEDQYEMLIGGVRDLIYSLQVTSNSVRDNVQHIKLYQQLKKSQVNEKSRELILKQMGENFEVTENLYFETDRLSFFLEDEKPAWYREEASRKVLDMDDKSWLTIFAKISMYERYLQLINELVINCKIHVYISKKMEKANGG